MLAEWEVCSTRRTWVRSQCLSNHGMGEFTIVGTDADSNPTSLVMLVDFLKLI